MGGSWLADLLLRILPLTLPLWAAPLQAARREIDAADRAREAAEAQAETYRETAESSAKDRDAALSEIASLRHTVTTLESSQEDAAARLSKTIASETNLKEKLREVVSRFKVRLPLLFRGVDL